MDLDKFEYAMLDVVLEAFGNQDSLTREQLLEIFDRDEPMAAAIVSTLAADDMVAEVGLSEQNYLPVLLIKKPKVSSFLERGGYTMQAEVEAEKKQSDPEPEQLQKQNLRPIEVEVEKKQSDPELDELQKQNLILENKNLQYQKTIIKQEEQITSLTLKTKQMEYLKLLWWVIGILLFFIVVLSYKLIVKHHH